MIYGVIMISAWCLLGGWRCVSRHALSAERRSNLTFVWLGTRGQPTRTLIWLLSRLTCCPVAFRLGGSSLPICRASPTNINIRSHPGYAPFEIHDCYCPYAGVGIQGAAWMRFITATFNTLYCLLPHRPLVSAFKTVLRNTFLRLISRLKRQLPHFTVAFSGLLRLAHHGACGAGSCKRTRHLIRGPSMTQQL
jgi:hypothetical protein